MNTPPTFTSAAVVSTVENRTGTVYTATATDAQSNPITFTISGGVDADRFAITPAGSLTFATPANYEAPTDSDADNVYLVTLSANDGTATTSFNLSVTVTNSHEGIQVRRIATAFVNPVAVFSLPGQATIVVVQQDGSLIDLDPATGARSSIIGLDCPTPSGQTSGVQAVTVGQRNAFEGAYNLFVLCKTPAGNLLLDSYDINSNRTALFNRTTILNIAPSPSGMSPGGALAFDFDRRLLFVATPDGGGRSDASDTATPFNSPFGKVMRVVQARDPGPVVPLSSYTVLTNGWGLHSPFGGFMLDQGFVFGDRGQDYFEEIDRYLDPSFGFARFAWPYREGTLLIREGLSGEVTDPLLEYRRGTGPMMGTGVIGGVAFPDTPAQGGLAGRYIFGDVNGSIFVVPVSSFSATRTLSGTGFERRTEDFAPDVARIDRLVAITADASGRAYLIDGDGDIFRVDTE